MSHKPSPIATAFSALPGHRVVALEGPDAAKFAQAQFMGDVAQLGDGHWQWNGWLTPKGRVIALFALLRIDASRIWLLLPDADPDGLVTDLRRLLFRSKLRIEMRPDLHVSGAMDHARLASGAHMVTSIDGEIELDMHGDGGGRCLRIGTPRPADGASSFAAAWAAADLQHGLPRLPPTDAPQWTPQQLSLDRLAAYSVRKGCYPGQEIVARTHFLGKAKRGVVLLRIEDATGAIEPGAAVEADGTTIGTVASAALLDGIALALAVLPIDVGGASAGGASASGASASGASAGVDLAVSAQPAARVALQAGLAR